MQHPTRAALHTALANLVAAGGVFDPATIFVGLYQGIAPPAGPESVMANLTEATYTGYARQALTPWTSPYNASVGFVTIDGPALHFTPADGVVPNTILGWFIASAAVGGTLLAIEPLATPAPLIDADSTLSIMPRFAIDPTASFGDSPEVN
jgi:hypothetical protein